MCGGIILQDTYVRLNKIAHNIISSYPAESAGLCFFWNFASRQQVSSVPSDIIP